MEKVIVKDKATLDELYNCSALTIEGLVPTDASLGELLDWIKALTPMKRERVYVVSGAVMNAMYGLTGSNAYKPDFSLVCVKLSDMEQPGKIIVPRFTIGGRWFDDVVDNNARREEN